MVTAKLRKNLTTHMTSPSQVTMPCSGWTEEETEYLFYRSLTRTIQQSWQQTYINKNKQFRSHSMQTPPNCNYTSLNIDKWHFYFANISDGWLASEMQQWSIGDVTKGWLAELATLLMAVQAIEVKDKGLVSFLGLFRTDTLLLEHGQSEFCAKCHFYDCDIYDAPRNHWFSFLSNGQWKTVIFNHEYNYAYITTLIKSLRRAWVTRSPTWIWRFSSALFHAIICSPSHHMHLVSCPVAETSLDKTILFGLFPSIRAVRKHPLPCELRETALKLITGLDLERLSPRAAVAMRLKKFK